VALFVGRSRFKFWQKNPDTEKGHVACAQANLKDLKKAWLYPYYCVYAALILASNLRYLGKLRRIFG
jgi:hypothetical protein